MIETVLRNDLSDQRITSLVTKNDFNEPNIHLLHAPEMTKPPYVEYQIISDTGNHYEEGELKDSSVTIQVDVFTFGSYTSLRDIIKKVLVEKGYIYPNAGGFGSFYEDETKLYHCLLRFEKEY